MTDDHEAKRQAAVESYTLFVLNPSETGGVEYDLWYNHGPFETPLLSEGATGQLTVNTISKDLGDGIPVTEAFVDSVAYGYHHTMAMMTQTSEAIDDVIERMYDHPVPKQDRWAIHHLVYMMRFSDEPLPPEFREIVDYTETCTEFGVPDVQESPIPKMGDNQ